MLDLSKWRSGLWPNSWGWFRILIPYQEKFYKASCYHDIAYDLWVNEDDKRQADRDFYLHCLRECNNKFEWQFARFYYFLVKSYWHYYFNYK